MKSLLLITLAAALLSLNFSPRALAQQPDPRDVVPPTPQKPLVSGTLTVVTPSTVQTPTANPVAVTPQTTSAPAPAKPYVPPTAAVETNADPLPVPDPSSTWGGSNVAPASVWEKTSTTTNAFAPGQSPAPDPWKPTTPPAKSSDFSPSLGAPDKKTDWK